MKHPLVPFSVPRTIDPDLARVRDYWESLKRRGNNMPFWDDFKISSLPDLAEKLMLVDVYEKPDRFRLNSVGQRLIERYGATLNSRFIDELELKNPLEYLPSQCSATVESQAPTYYSHGMGEVEKSPGPVSYSRLLLPMWGNRQMLLGAFAWR